MKFLSWNVNARVRAATDQAAAIIACHPDVVTLQEVTAATRGVLRQALAGGGLAFTVDSFELLASIAHLKGPRRYGLLIADPSGTTMGTLDLASAIALSRSKNHSAGHPASG